MDGYKIKNELIVPASKGNAVVVEKGDLIEIIDIKGKQVGDLMAWVLDSKEEWFSPAHSITQNWSIKLNPGDLLVTNLRREILKIVSDDVGYHDIVVPCCDKEAYIRRYGLENHRSCLGNISDALSELGEERHISGELAWNVFMKNKIGNNGEMIYEEPTHNPGAKIILEVLIDSLIALSACPQDQTPTNGWNCSEMKIIVWNKID
mgnify:FL=1